MQLVSQVRLDRRSIIICYSVIPQESLFFAVALFLVAFLFLSGHYNRRILVNAVTTMECPPYAVYANRRHEYFIFRLCIRNSQPPPGKEEKGKRYLPLFHRIEDRFSISLTRVIGVVASHWKVVDAWQMIEFVFTFGG